MALLTTINLLIGVLDVVPANAAGWAQAALTVIWAFVYQVTIGAIAFVLLGETSTIGLRAKTTALATATQSVFGIIMDICVPYMVNPDAGGLGLIATAGCFFLYS